ncbi:MAG: membrane receptor RagA [Muribaculaceae bacterium]|nr:membrane receptor RagA [Muribaculaceae bacterium]MBQ7211461.1 membrane receptor RagA [Muribaculaceae bacterium]
MEKGKKICKALKEIRKEIAKANDIDYEPHECHHEGDCAGTCPACESEVRWLESRLRCRQSLGKAVVLGGLTVAMGALVSSCDLRPSQTAGMPEMEGDIVCPDDSLATDSITCNPVAADSADVVSLNSIVGEEPQLAGDIAADPQESDGDE